MKRLKLEAIDHESIVKSLVKEYIKPKFPIYRVKLVISEMFFNEEREEFQLRTIFKSMLLELKESPHCPCCKIYLSDTNSYVTPKAVEVFNETGIVKDYRDEDVHLTLVDIKKIA
jgi:hypothetical protein